MNSGKNYDIGVGVGGFAGQFEGITNEVGDVLNVGVLVIVGENDGVQLLFEGVNCCKQVVGQSGLGQVWRRCGDKHS